MGKYSNISGRKAVTIFKKYGYEFARQTGSHIILKHSSKPTITIPDHKELAPGLIRALLSQSGIDPADFLKRL
ncbi:MAG: type II toxin-antitoxin system HicA family toxin [Proteobacteria bacterium]|nr:type II toxin-antitoxin system HicA family toxin [Pseudomonadota bacterium]